MALVLSGPELGRQQVLLEYYRRLLAELGPQGWWPARTRLEVILGAILVQNTAWENARQALARLRQAGLLSLPRLRRLPGLELQEYIRPAGFYRQKARTIRGFLDWLGKHHGWSLDRLFQRPAGEVRQELLSLKGLGLETVDAILLYAGRQPWFVADAYTRRILARHELVPATDGYATVQEFLHQHLPADHRLYNEYHALLVEVGKRHCRNAAPRCDECPLRDFLPAPSLTVAITATAPGLRSRTSTRPSAS
ncbi:MAG TPA: endonuclease III domain-containing protein [Terriglobia bacterium]|nr:endonuclease III domain-containing protein [Terriglobia bacterium]